ncbi:MAG: FeoA domain-containing protein [Eubacteriales bacterium]|jgi:ferrous iron transport protein A|nr:FeoA domain-containing protein [Eubacteriales bacterium]
MMPLTLANAGDEMLVRKVNGTKEVKKHLEDMGFVDGAVVKVVSKVGKGNLVISVKGARFALGSQLAMKIMADKKEN